MDITTQRILDYAISLRAEYIATAADYGIDDKRTNALRAKYRAIAEMYHDLTDRCLSDDITESI